MTSGVTINKINAGLQHTTTLPGQFQYRYVQNKAPHETGVGLKRVEFCGTG